MFFYNNHVYLYIYKIVKFSRILGKFTNEQFTHIKNRDLVRMSNFVFY